MRTITYESMNEKIVGLLEFREDPICHYAAARIEELQAQVARTEEALTCCGITSFFPALEGPADAIWQMARYILGARGTDGAGRNCDMEVG